MNKLSHLNFVFVFVRRSFIDVVVNKSPRAHFSLCPVHLRLGPTRFRSAPGHFGHVGMDGAR